MSTKALSAATEFPPEVHQSLADLRAIAKAATSKDDPRLRRATPDELALAELKRKPHHCVGYSSRTGLPCTQNRLEGLKVCRRHGGAGKHVRKALLRRAAEAAPSLLESQITRALDISPEGNAVGFKAAQDVLDRFGFGAVVQAKVRASKKQEQSGPSVTVNIGFLGNGS